MSSYHSWLHQPHTPCNNNDASNLSLKKRRERNISTNSPQRQLHSRKRPRGNRHSTQQSRSNPLPKPPRTLPDPSLRKSTPHTPVSSLRSKPISLHFRFNHIKRIRSNPQHFARQPSIQRHLPRRNIFAHHRIASAVRGHEIFKGEKPGAVGGSFAEESDGCSAVDSCEAEFADDVERAVVEFGGAVGLGLQADTDVFDGGGEDGVGEAGEGSCCVVLGISQGLLFLGKKGFAECVVFVVVVGFECSFGVVECAELDGDAGAYADQGGESAFVKGGGAFILQDSRRAVEGTLVFGCRL